MKIPRKCGLLFLVVVLYPAAFASHVKVSNYNFELISVIVHQPWEHFN